MKIIKINMTTESVRSMDVPPEYTGLGGRGLTSTMIDREVEPTCDPLGPDNKLIFAPGYLSGTPLVNSSRLSIGAKSPLTGTIKESNVGGTVAADLAHLGITAVIVDGKVSEDSYYLIRIDAQGTATLIDGKPFKGMRTYELVSKLKEEFGEKNSITCIGPAGDFQLNGCLDSDNRCRRQTLQGGWKGWLRCCHGFKRNQSRYRGTRRQKTLILWSDPNTFKTAAKRYAKAVKEDEFSGEILPQLGSAVLVAPINAVGAFPTCNARWGQFEQVEKITGETMAGIIKKRGGKTTHKGCAQCIIHCSNEYVDEAGHYVTSSLEYETIWSMGGMLGNADLDSIAKLDFLCDDIGLDTISTGVAIAVAMDAGYRKFGDGQAAMDMVEAVAHGTTFGKILGNGPAAVGKHFNHDRVPVVKGQSISAYDPRAIQGMAVTYATSTMGADHTAGFVVEKNLEEFGGTLDRFAAEGQVEASRNAQIHMAVVDTVGICDFAQTGFAAPDGLGNVCKMVTAKGGKPFGTDDWTNLGIRILKAERRFNRRAGFTNKDDRLPEMFYKEPLPPHNTVVVISDEEMDTTFDF